MISSTQQNRNQCTLSTSVPNKNVLSYKQSAAYKQKSLWAVCKTDYEPTDINKYVHSNQFCSHTGAVFAEEFSCDNYLNLPQKTTIYLCEAQVNGSLWCNSNKRIFIKGKGRKNLPFFRT